VKAIDAVLLLTATVNPNAFGTPLTTITDPERRWKEYESNLIRIIDEGVFKNIVFCENSGFHSGFAACEQRAAEKGVNIEFLVFNGNQAQIAALGKGYGEGEILKHIMAHSKVLRSDTVFYKLTGRIQIVNLKEIVRRHMKEDVLFIKADRSLPRVDTRFFKCSVTFFKQYLEDAFKEVNDTEENFLEMVYYKKLQGLNVKSFDVYPEYIGTSGSTGKGYELSILDRLKYALFLKLGWLNV
jgi:hypothetical protein